MDYQPYVSDELTHFVGRRERTDESRYRLLIEILASGRLTSAPDAPGNSVSWLIDCSAKISQNEMYLPTVVCFCDIPLRGLALHMRKYSPFGIAFPRSLLLQKGASPVLYVATNSFVPKLDETRAEALDKLVPGLIRLLKAAERRGDADAGWIRGDIEFLMFNAVKFFDADLPDDDPKNFYMEREWRVPGSMSFQPADVSRVILPESFAARFASEMPEYRQRLHHVPEMESRQ